MACANTHAHARTQADTHTHTLSPELRPLPLSSLLTIGSPLRMSYFFLLYFFLSYFRKHLKAKHRNPRDHMTVMVVSSPRNHNICRAPLQTGVKSPVSEGQTVGLSE